jgi:Tol biopolymer transport system component
MGRRATVLVALAVALAGLAIGLGLDLVDDGDSAGSAGSAPSSAPAPPTGDPCRDDPPLVAVDGTDQVASGRSHVLVVRPDGSRARATPDDWVATEPDVAPDGQRLVVVRADGDYESAGPEATGLWTIGLDGSDPQPVTAGDWYDTSPRWSPDGTTIALVRTSYAEVVENRIVVVAAGGSEPRELARADGDTQVRAPAWSPDGSRLAYVRQSRDPSGRPEAATLWTVGADGTGAVEVGPVDPDATSVDWHPDGDRLLVGSLVSSESGSLALVDLATGTSTVLAREATWGRWSRAGTHVVHHTLVGEGRTSSWSLVERPLDGTTLGPPRDLDVDTAFFYGYYGLAVAPCP